MDAALRAWRVLEQFLPVGHAHSSSSYEERLGGVVGVEGRWPELRRLWLEVWSERDADEVDKQLDEMRSNVAAQRERLAMVLEERAQRRAMAVRRRLMRMLLQWQRLDDQRLQSAARAAAKREATAKRETRKQMADRLREMCRKDLTMDDMLCETPRTDKI